jgi:RNA polymerase sigma-70 factor (ECF subfamily)
MNARVNIDRGSWYARPTPGRTAKIYMVADRRDADLLARLRAGERSAFVEFYDRHATLLYSVAARVLGDRREAEDVLQEVMLQIWRKPDGYDAELGALGSWAVTLTRNKAIDRVRAANRGVRLLRKITQSAADPEGTPSANELVYGAERAARVRAAVEELPHEQREAIELAFFGGLSQTEIATHLQQPLGTVKARIRRGMLTLRERLGGVT